MIVLATILLLSAFLLYVVIGISSGYGVSVRFLEGKKLDKKETFLAILTVPLSLVTFLVSILITMTLLINKYRRARKIMGSE